MREHFIQGSRVRHQTTRRGNYDFWVNLNSLFQGATLVAAIGIGAIEVVNFRDAATSKFFNLTTQFNEGVAQIFGQALAQSCFSRPAQTNERNAFGSLRFLSCSKQHRHLLAYTAQIGFASGTQHFAQQQPLGRAGGHVANQLSQGTLQSACDL